MPGANFISFWIRLRSPMSQSKSPANEQTVFSFQRTTGAVSRRLFTFFLSPECENPSARVSRSRSKNVRIDPAGELEDRLHKTSAARREENRSLGFAEQSRSVARDSQTQSDSNTAALRKTAGRLGRRLFATHKHSAPIGLSDPQKGPGSEGAPNVDPLRLDRRVAARPSSVRRRLNQAEIAALAAVEDVDARAPGVEENEKLAVRHFELEHRFVDEHRFDR